MCVRAEPDYSHLSPRTLYLVLLEVYAPPPPHHEQKEGDGDQEPGRPLCEGVGMQHQTKACQVPPGFRLRTSGRAVPARGLCSGTGGKGGLSCPLPATAGPATCGQGQ